MKLRKLSEIAPLPPVAVTDQIVGVIDGTTDALFSLIQLHDLVNAPSNLDFYVATTGSDSNPGTIGSPFLTIQYALNVAASYNYGGLYFPTIHIADGTFVVSRSIQVPQITLSSQRAVIACNPANPQNVVIDVSAAGPGIGLFLVSGSNNHWQIDGFQGNATGGVFVVTFGAKVEVSNDVFCYDPTNGGLLYLANIQNGGQFNAGDINVTFLSTTIAGIVQAQSYSAALIFRATVNLQANTNAFNGLYFASSFSEIITVTMTYTGTAGLVSSGSSDIQFSVVFTSNGLASDIPDGLFVDGNSIFGDASLQFFQQGFISGPPTPTNLPVQTSWAILYDSVNGDAYLAVNVAGSVRSIKIEPPLPLDLPYQVTAPVNGGTVTSAPLLKANILNPAGVLATLTVTMPTNQPDGFTTRFSTTQTITAITFVDPGANPIVGAPTTLAAGSGVQFIWDDTLNTWYIG